MGARVLQLREDGWLDRDPGFNSLLFIKLEKVAMKATIVYLLFCGAICFCLLTCGSGKKYPLNIVSSINNSNLVPPPVNTSAIFVSKDKATKIDYIHRPVIRTVINDSTILKMVGTIDSLTKDNKAYHNRAIITADRRFNEMAHRDSVDRKKDSVIMAQQQIIKDKNDEIAMKDTLAHSYQVTTKWFPFIMGVIMIVIGAISWKAGWKARGNYDQQII